MSPIPNNQRKVSENEKLRIQRISIKEEQDHERAHTPMAGSAGGKFNKGKFKFNI